MAVDISVRPITVREYQRMVDVGILAVDERVELLDGMLVNIPPIGVAHQFSHTDIVSYLIRRLDERFVVAGQSSIPLGPVDEPQPDVVIFRREYRATPKDRWSEFVVALIEISESSWARDTGRKLRVYARAGVPEYLVVDLSRRRLIRYRDPAGERYRDIAEFGPADPFTLAALPEVQLTPASFFPSDASV